MSFFIGLFGNALTNEITGLAYWLADRWLVSTCRQIGGPVAERLLEECRADLAANPSVLYRLNYVFQLARGRQDVDDAARELEPTIETKDRVEWKGIVYGPGWRLDSNYLPVRPTPGVTGTFTNTSDTGDAALPRSSVKPDTVYFGGSPPPHGG